MKTYKRFINWLECKIVEWTPDARRTFAVQLLVWSCVLMVLNVALYLLGIVGVNDLILVTLVLSFLAITFTAADMIATTDVRAEVDS